MMMMNQVKNQKNLKNQKKRNFFFVKKNKMTNFAVII